MARYLQLFIYPLLTRLTLKHLKSLTEQFKLYINNFIIFFEVSKKKIKTPGLKRQIRED